MSFWILAEHQFTQDAEWPEHWHCSCGAQVGGYDYEGAKRDHLLRVKQDAHIPARQCGSLSRNCSIAADRPSACAHESAT